MKGKLLGIGVFLFLASVGVANVPPVTEPQVVYTAVGQPVGVELRATDPDGDPLTIRITAHPEHGVLLGEPPVLFYIPAAGFRGTDGFTYEVSDPQGDFDVGTVKIKVGKEGGLTTQGTPIKVLRYTGFLKFWLGEKIVLHFTARSAPEVNPVVIEPGTGLVSAPCEVLDEGMYKKFMWDSRTLGPGRFLVGVYYGRVLCLFTVVITERAKA